MEWKEDSIAFVVMIISTGVIDYAHTPDALENILNANKGNQYTE